MTTDVTGAQNAAAQTASAVSSTAADVSNAATTVDKTVAHQLTITERIFDKVQHFAETKGIDIVMAIIVLVIGYIISREIKVWTRNILKRSNVDPNAIGFITEIVYFICLLFVMTIVFGMLGISTSSLIAALGGIGLAIGLALKDNFSNVASGIFILIFRPFSVGDYIVANGVEGTVAEIAIIYTKIRTLGNQMIAVPNNTMTSSIIKNYSHYELRNLELTFDVGYDSDLRSCLHLIREEILKSAYIQDKENVTVYISEMADSSIRVYTRCQVKATDYYTARTEIIISVKEALDRAGIDIPFPQLVIHQSDK